MAYINLEPDDRGVDNATQSTNKCGKNGARGLCILWRRGDKCTLIAMPIILLSLLCLMVVANHALIAVWCLSVFVVCGLLVWAYFYGYPLRDAEHTSTVSMLDQFSWSLLYGAVMSFFAWCFCWILARVGNLLVGPFIFYHADFRAHSQAHSICFAVVACAMYGAGFLFFLLWLKVDKRMCDRCGVKHCKLSDADSFRDFEQLRQSMALDVPLQQMQDFIVQNERLILDKLQVALKRLRIECVCILVAYFGTGYIWTLVLSLKGMNMTDTTLIFVLGFLVKDFLFAITMGTLASYEIGRYRLYGVTGSCGCGGRYLMVMFLGILQQCPGTILCSLYPHVTIRMDIVYVIVAINAVICVFAWFEIYRQRKLLNAQLNVLSISDLHVNNQ